MHRLQNKSWKTDVRLQSFSFDEAHMVGPVYSVRSFGLFLLCKHSDCSVTVSKVPITNSKS